MKHELKLILDSTHDAMIAVDQDGIITLFNRAAEVLTHYKSQEVMGRPIQDVVKNTRLLEVMKSGVAELDQKQQLGQVSIITNRMPVRDEDGRIVGAIAVFRDIGEVSKLAEKITDLKQIYSIK